MIILLLASQTYIKDSFKQKTIELIKLKNMYINHNKNVSLRLSITIFTIAFMYLSNLEIVRSIHITMTKNYIYIPQNDYYKFHISLNRSNADILPLNISIDYIVQNSIPNLGKNFDYFYYLQDKDLQCYYNSINNKSYLFPCPFLVNNQTILRQDQIDRLNQFTDIPVGVINNANLTFIIDNTPYPYPQGAYPIGALDIYSSVILKIDLDDSYEVLGVRLVFINITIFLLYGCFIGKLIYDTQKLKQLMNDQQKQSYHKSLNNQQVNKFKSSQIGSQSENSQGYDEGYQILMNPDLTKSAMSRRNGQSILSSNNQIMKKQN